MELGWAKKSKKNYYVPVVSQMVYLSLLPATMAELVDFSKAVGLYACKVKDLWHLHLSISAPLLLFKSSNPMRWHRADNKM